MAHEDIELPIPEKLNKFALALKGEEDAKELLEIVKDMVKGAGSKRKRDGLLEAKEELKEAREKVKLSAEGLAFLPVITVGSREDLELVDILRTHFCYTGPVGVKEEDDDLKRRAVRIGFKVVTIN